MRVSSCESPICRLLLLSLSLLVCGGCVQLALGAAEPTNGVDNENNFLTEVRPRLGNFERYPELLELYEDYFYKVLRHKDKALKDLPNSDWRTVRPTAVYCVSFLNTFRTKKYMIGKPIDIIPLDACLELIFLDTNSVADKSSPEWERAERAIRERESDLKRLKAYNRKQVESLRSDSRLESLYRGTMFHDASGSVPDATQQMLKEYLTKLMDVYVKFPSKGCHSLWLEAYTNFIEQQYLDCAGKPDCVHFNDESIDEDRYFRLVVESTRQSSLNCYQNMQKQILSLMHDSYDNRALPSKLSAAFKSAVKSLVEKGSSSSSPEKEKRSREMIRILQLVGSGGRTDSPISLGNVTKTLWAIKSGDEDISSGFLESLGRYAIDNANMLETQDDPQGVKRYAKAMTRLCKPYIDENMFLAMTGGFDMDEDEMENKQPFLFYHLIYSLIRLTNHESIYGISKDQFENDVLKNNWEALYLTTLTCQVMSTTTGEVSQDANEDVYQVSFQFESEKYYEDWPLAVMNQKLVKVAGKPDQSGIIEPPPAASTTSRPPQVQQPDSAEPQAEPTQPQAGERQAAVAAVAEVTTKKPSRGLMKLDLGSKLKKLSKLKDSLLRPASAPAAGPPRTWYQSEETIRRIHAASGRWPELPHWIRELYPNLPEEAVGKRPPSPSPVVIAPPGSPAHFSNTGTKFMPAAYQSQQATGGVGLSGLLAPSQPADEPYVFFPKKEPAPVVTAPKPRRPSNDIF